MAFNNVLAVKLYRPLVIWGLSFALVVLSHSSNAYDTPAPITGPLVGKIYSDANHQWRRADVLNSLLLADVIYLSEQHDNPAHHRLQGEIIQYLVDHDRAPAIALEVVAFTQTSELLTYTTTASTDVHSKFADAILREKLQWGGENGYYWRHYGAILQLARAHNLEAVGMDLPRALRYRIAKSGIDALSSVEKSLFAPSGFKDKLYQQLMYQSLKSAHCGYGSQSYLGKLYEIWLARNDRMAATIAQVAMADNKTPVVIIVGSGHTKFGLGVNERLGVLAPRLKQVNIGFREIRTSNDQVTDHIKAFSFGGRNFGLEFDFYWFTKGLLATRDSCGAYLKHKSNDK